MSRAITTRDRGLGARWAGELEAARRSGCSPGRLRFDLLGTAGQSFGAFLVQGLELALAGDAQDGVGKGMSGGSIALRPHPSWRPERHGVIAGNAVLYGATGGTLFAAGRVGERFAIRNSGARAVVEGCGDHGCEYMTGGAVIVLGPVGHNFGAGMNGGRAWVWDPHATLHLHLDPSSVTAGPVEESAAELRALLERHREATRSVLAAHVLGRWESCRQQFVLVTPGVDRTPLPQPVAASSATR